MESPLCCIHVFLHDIHLQWSNSLTIIFLLQGVQTLLLEIAVLMDGSTF